MNARLILSQPSNFSLKINKQKYPYYCALDKISFTYGHRSQKIPVPVRSLIRQAANRRTSSQVGDNWRIPAAVCVFFFFCEVVGELATVSIPLRNRKIEGI
jgi:hypothetical protein